MFQSFMIALLFTKQDCPKCTFVKDRIASGKVGEVKVIDAEKPAGLAELSFYDLSSSEVPLPVLVLVDKETDWKPTEVVGLDHRTAATDIVKRLHELGGGQKSVQVAEEAAR